jgi:hypothetical protein
MSALCARAVLFAGLCERPPHRNDKTPPLQDLMKLKPMICVVIVSVALINFFLVAMRFELRASYLLGKLSSHLNHSASPALINFMIVLVTYGPHDFPLLSTTCVVIYHFIFVVK